MEERELAEEPKTTRICRSYKGREQNGSAVVDVVLVAAILIFIIMPVFSAVIEKYILLDKAQMIKDAVDMTNLSAYDAISAGSLGRVSVDFDRDRLTGIYRSLLSANLKLGSDLYPLPGSLAEDRVGIESLEIYTGDFPQTCPRGVAVTRPSVHSCISVPVRPSLYRQIILDLLGREYVDLEVHVDSEIPVNN